MQQLGWDMAELQRQANINYRTARRALDGEEVTARVARDIARALSEALGTTVHPGAIRGLKFR